MGLNFSAYSTEEIIDFLRKQVKDGIVKTIMDKYHVTDVQLATDPADQDKIISVRQDMLVTATCTQLLLGPRTTSKYQKASISSCMKCSPRLWN